VVQLSLRDALTLHSIGEIKPDFVACLATFIALFAPRTTTLWACWLLGLAMDLAPAAGPAPWHLVGPSALGYVFGGYLVVQARAMVFRRRALTTGFMTFVFVLAAAIVATFLLMVRSWYLSDTPIAHNPLAEFWQRFKVALYSGLVGVPFGWLLQLTIVMWGFQGGGGRRSW
jgi:cell shape-determining protein MreD